MERKLAEIISWVFQPVLMPLYGTLILLNFDGYFSILLTGQARWVIVGVILLMTVFVPALIILLLRSVNMISSLRLENRKERILPFLGTGFAYYMTYNMIRSFGIPGYYNLFLLGATLLVVIAIIINKFWKISIHMMALGALAGMFIALSPYSLGVNPVFVYLIVMAAGLTGFARLKLEVHTPAQVYTGFLTGLGFMFGLFQIVS